MHVVSMNGTVTVYNAIGDALVSMNGTVTVSDTI